MCNEIKKMMSCSLFTKSGIKLGGNLGEIVALGAEISP